MEIYILLITQIARSTGIGLVTDGSVRQREELIPALDYWENRSKTLLDKVQQHLMESGYPFSIVSCQRKHNEISRAKEIYKKIFKSSESAIQVQGWRSWGIVNIHFQMLKHPLWLVCNDCGHYRIYDMPHYHLTRSSHTPLQGVYVLMLKTLWQVITATDEHAHFGIKKC